MGKVAVAFKLVDGMSLEELRFLEARIKRVKSSRALSGMPKSDGGVDDGGE